MDEITARTQQPGHLELPWLRRRAEAEIAALVGVAPVARDKGRRKGRRAVLYMAAVAVSRHRNRLAGFCRRLVGRGKPKMPAPVAVGRTMIVTLNAMAKAGTAWKAEMALAA